MHYQFVSSQKSAARLAAAACCHHRASQVVLTTAATGSLLVRAAASSSQATLSLNSSDPAKLLSGSCSSRREVPPSGLCKACRPRAPRHAAQHAPSRYRRQHGRAVSRRPWPSARLTGSQARLPGWSQGVMTWEPVEQRVTASLHIHAQAALALGQGKWRDCPPLLTSTSLGWWTGKRGCLWWPSAKASCCRRVGRWCPPGAAGLRLGMGTGRCRGRGCTRCCCACSTGDG